MKKHSKETFTQNIIALLISQILIKFLGIIYKLYITNRQGFGDAGNAISTSSYQVYALILSLSAIGLPSAISKIVAERGSQGDGRGAYKILKVSLLLFSIIGIIGSITVGVMAKEIATLYLKIPEAELSIIAIAPSIFFTSIISVFKGYFGGRENLKVTAKAQSIDQVTKTVMTFILIELSVILTHNPDTTIMAACSCLAITVANLLECAFLVKKYITERPIIRQEVKESIHNTRAKTFQIIKEIAIVSIPISLSALIGTISKNIDATTIVNKLKDKIGYEQAKIQYGILSGKVDTLINFPLSFNMAITTALLPNIAASNGDLKTKEERINKSILFGATISIPIIMLFMIFGKEILKVLFPNASDGSEILKISSLSIIFIALGQTFNGVLYGIGKTNIPIISVSVGVIAKLICNQILVPHVEWKIGGTVGAAIGGIIYNATTMIISYIAIKKYTPIIIKKSSIIKPILASTIMTIISKMIFGYLILSTKLSIALIITIFIGAIIYIMLLILMKAIRVNEISIIICGMKRR
jgi:stage V sporulation protein B